MKALLSHVLGGMEGNARVREFVRQLRAATKAAKQSGRPMIDEMTAAQVLEHASLSPAEMQRRMREVAPKAVARPTPYPGAGARPALQARTTDRRRLEARLPGRHDLEPRLVDAPHRSHARRRAATSCSPREHDGRIVADVVAEWARTHGQPFDLLLDGPAGGSFVQGENGESLHLDAVEFCRILSGRSAGSGLLDQEVPF